MSKQGFVKLYRQIEENELYFCEAFDKTHAWIDLILLANHKDNILFVRGNEIKIKRGQVAWSKENLATRWKWSKNKVYRFLETLNRLGQIDYKTNQQKNNVLGLITIINYDEYQTTEQQTNQQKDRRRTNRRTTKKNVKNVKNDNNIISKQSLQETEIEICPTKNLEGTRNPTNEIIDIFYQYSKNNRLFAMKCQRKAVEDLIKQFDVESVIKFAEFAVSCNGKPYAPQITTPLQLQSKMGQLRAFYEQLKNKQTNTITKI